MVRIILGKIGSFAHQSGKEANFAPKRGQLVHFVVNLFLREYTPFWGEIELWWAVGRKFQVLGVWKYEQSIQRPQINLQLTGFVLKSRCYDYFLKNVKKFTFSSKPRRFSHKNLHFLLPFGSSKKKSSIVKIRLAHQCDEK